MLALWTVTFSMFGKGDALNKVDFFKIIQWPQGSFLMEKSPVITQVADSTHSQMQYYMYELHSRIYIFSLFIVIKTYGQHMAVVAKVDEQWIKVSVRILTTNVSHTL